MAHPVGSVGSSHGPRRLRRRGVSETADAASSAKAEAVSAPQAAAPIPPVGERPEDALSAHLIGQAGPAESATPANSARQAHSTYMAVEWSGPLDRRTRRGRIAKTEV